MLFLKRLSDVLEEEGEKVVVQQIDKGRKVAQAHFTAYRWL